MIVSDAMSDHQVMVLASSIEGIVGFLGSVHTTRKRLIGVQRQLKSEGKDYRALVNANDLIIRNPGEAPGLQLIHNNPSAGCPQAA
jgi:hypothetical protein